MWTDIVDAVATTDTSAKSALRQRLLAVRRAVDAEVHAAEAEALAEHLSELALPGATICAYAPVGTEPGSIAMLNRLVHRGVRVLLPVVGAGDPVTAEDGPQPLRWGHYRPGGLVTGRFGLLEPAPPWLPAAALAEAAQVIVPALAVDHRGVRLGRGAGFYDRSLLLREPTAELIAVVRDAELVEELPAEAHDVPMTHALTPGRGLVALPGMHTTK